MMKLKFRAWEITGKKMLNNVGYHPFILEFYEGYGDDEDGAYLITPRAINYILMQYTGIEDKDGKEIYESDIVRVDCKNWVVCFEDFQWLINAKTKSGYSKSIISNTNYIGKYIVVGNIYANPELL